MLYALAAILLVIAIAYAAGLSARLLRAWKRRERRMSKGSSDDIAADLAPFLQQIADSADAIDRKLASRDQSASNLGRRMQELEHELHLLHEMLANREPIVQTTGRPSAPSIVRGTAEDLRPAVGETGERIVAAKSAELRAVIPISEREAEAVRLAATGLSPRQVAESLGCRTAEVELLLGISRSRAANPTSAADSVAISGSPS